MDFKRASFLFVVLLFSGAGSLNAQAVGDRTSVDLTIYNFDLALIRETRPIALTSGLNTVVLPEIPATIDGTSLHFTSLTDPQIGRAHV